MTERPTGKRTRAYRKADKLVGEAIGGLFTADPPEQIPGLDSDRVTIVARLVRDRDAVDRSGEPAEQPAPPVKPAPPRHPRPASRKKVIESIDRLDDADRPRPDWEPEPD